MISLDARKARSHPSFIVYFATPTFNETREKLKSLSVRFEGPVETVQETAQGDLKLQQFYDPDGNSLAVMGLVSHGPNR